MRKSIYINIKEFAQSVNYIFPLYIPQKLLILTLLFILQTNTFAQHETKIFFQDGIKYITHASNGKWENSQTFSCSLVQTFGINQKNPEGYLKGPGAIFVDKDDIIYISDYLSDKLKIYDKNGNLFRIISKNNLKENDFERPGSIIVDYNKNIYLKCSGKSRIYVFSFQGKFLKSINTPKYTCSLLYLFGNDKKFIYIPHFADKSNELKIKGPIAPLINDEIKLPSFGNQLRTDSRMDYLGGATMASSILSNGRIVIAYLFPFEVHIYSSDGDLQTLITRKDAVFSETYQYRNLLLTRRRLSSILPFPDGKFMIAYLDRGEDWIERAKNGDVTSYPDIIYDLYDSEGIFLQEFEQPTNLLGILFFADYKGFVYEKSYPKYPDKAGEFVINKYHVEFRNK